MVATVVQDCLSLLRAYPVVAQEASNRARFGRGLDSLQFGVQMGEVNLQQLLVLPPSERRDIVEQGPIIDWYLGETRVYKRTTRTLLFAMCPEIDRHIEPLDCQLVIRLPESFSNVLAVKLAVLYMEQYLINPKIRTAPWKVEDDIATYIYLADLFAFIGMSGVSRDVEDSILRRFRESPLHIDEIRAIWGRDNYARPSKYIEAMADNIVTFMCVPKLHLFAIEHDIDPDKTYEEAMKKKMQCMSAVARGVGSNNVRVQYETTLLERVLAAPRNLALKQLVWTADTFMPTTPLQCAEWVEIRSVRGRVAAQPHLTGMKKIVLARSGGMRSGGDL